jgi:hypothetical protein
MESRWYEGPLSADIVEAHETPHPRKDGVRLYDISVSAGGANGSNQHRHYYVPCDPQSWGNWIVVYPNSPFEGSLNITQLKAVDGVVYEQMGHTAWHPLNEKLESWDWAKAARFFPVGEDGLPSGFIAGQSN